MDRLRRVGRVGLGPRIQGTRGCGLLVGDHVHVPPNGVRWVGSPDRVESRFGWVLPGCGIAKRPLPRLIHRRRFTVLCWSRVGTAPAPLACGCTFRDASPLRGARRRRRRPHRLTLLPFVFSCLVVGPPSSQTEHGQKSAQESFCTRFIDLRCFIGSPTDGSRLPSQLLRGGAWDPGGLVECTRLNWHPEVPVPPRAIPSPDHRSDHRMPKPRQRRSSTGCRPCLSPRSRCNLQHRPDGTPVDARS
jgi:hypothetical protein